MKNFSFFIMSTVFLTCATVAEISLAQNANRNVVVNRNSMTPLRSPVGANQCNNGVVWREAIDNFQVCVNSIFTFRPPPPPGSQPNIPWDAVNQLLPQTLTCAPGYAWRKSGANDLACSDTAEISLAQTENRNASANRDPSATPQSTYGFNQCKNGFVWREAFTGDEVCVTTAPDRRTDYVRQNQKQWAISGARMVVANSGSQQCMACQTGFVPRSAGATDYACVPRVDASRVVQQNRNAAANRDPNATINSLYGPNQCKNGFVWREAFEGDMVCVTPDERTIAMRQNMAQWGNPNPRMVVAACPQAPAPTAYTIGGRLSGLSAGQSVVLHINGGNPLTLTSDGPFTFSQALAAGSNYTVSVSTQPTIQTCTITNGNGNNLASNQSNIGVACSNNIVNQPDVGNGISRVTIVPVNGIAVTTYKWLDSKGKERTVSLKKQGSGNAGNGGYAVQMTYYDGATLKTLSCNDAAFDGCWGYFVGHELYRNWNTQRPSGTIASLHGEDDSPLGRGFPVISSTASVITPNSTSATHQFTINYPKWGTRMPMDDVTAVTSVALADHQKFLLPLTTQWTFENGKDSPRIDIKIDMTAVQAGQLAFDVRGPYGVLYFANGDMQAALNNVQWGDTLTQATSNNTVSGNLLSTTNLDWTNLTPPTRAYHALTAISGGTTFEIGLYEYKLGGDTGLTYGGWNTDRGTSKAISAMNLDGWPFQSANYAGLSTNPSNGQKFAWGSSVFYGSKLSTVFFGPNKAAPIIAMPANKQLIYRTCLVLARTALVGAGSDTLTKTIALSAATPSCPASSLLN